MGNETAIACALLLVAAFGCITLESGSPRLQLAGTSCEESIGLDGCFYECRGQITNSGNATGSGRVIVTLVSSGGVETVKAYSDQVTLSPNETKSWRATADTRCGLGYNYSAVVNKTR